MSESHADQPAAEERMTEEKFEKRIEGVRLSDKERAILRKHLSLPYDEALIDTHPVLQKRALLLALHKLPSPAT